MENWHNISAMKTENERCWCPMCAGDRLVKVIGYLAVTGLVVGIIASFAGCAVTMPIGKGGELGSIRGSVEYLPPINWNANPDIPKGFRK